MGAAGGRTFQRMSPTAPSGPALETTPAGTRGLGASSCPSPIVWIVAHRVAAEGRGLMTWASGGAGQEAQWVPHGIERAYRGGDSVSFVWEEALQAVAVPNHTFLTDRNPDLLCAESAQASMG